MQTYNTCVDMEFVATLKSLLSETVNILLRSCDIYDFPSNLIHVLEPGVNVAPTRGQFSPRECLLMRHESGFTPPRSI